MEDSFHVLEIPVRQHERFTLLIPKKITLQQFIMKTVIILPPRYIRKKINESEQRY